MKKQISTPVAIAVIVVLVVVIVGVIALTSNGPKEGLRPDASAGGIQTQGGKVIPTAAGSGAPATGSAPSQQTSGAQ